MTGDCVRGCTHRGLHTPDCGCTLECPDHDGHCHGCLPRRAEFGQFCLPCADKLEANLRAIPRIADRLRPGPLANPGRQPGDRTSASTNPGSPSPGFDEWDEVHRWAYDWALLFADANHDRGTFKYTIAGIPVVVYLTTNTTYLLNRFGQVCDADTEGALWAEASAWVRRLQRVTSTDTLIHRLPHPCPSCRRKTLVRADGEDQVQCRNNACRRTWGEHEYANLAHVATS